MKPVPGVPVADLVLIEPYQSLADLEILFGAARVSADGYIVSPERDSKFCVAP